MSKHICFIHKNNGPIDVVFLHEHHRTPRAFGGTDDEDNLIWLCVPCHDLLHRLATMSMHGKRGLVEDVIAQYLPGDLNAQEKFKVLIHEVIQAKLAFAEKADDPDDTILMNLKIPKQVHSILKTCSMDHQHPNGRNMGLYSFTIKVLTQFAQNQLFGASSTPPLTGPGVQAAPPLLKQKAVAQDFVKFK